MYKVYKNKLYISANEVLNSSFILGNNILKIGYKPDMVVAVWRGGCFPGKSMHELFRYKELNTDSIVITCNSYIGINKAEEVKIDISKLSLEKLRKSVNILIVDDVFDTGKTMKKIVMMMKNNGINTNIRIATLFYKPDKNKTNIVPNYYLYKTDKWIVFPHELEDLTKEEIKYKSNEIASIIE